jgi:hypothetical protein
MNAPWQVIAPAPDVTGPDELALKHKFAEALLRDPHEPYRAAVLVFGSDSRRALAASQNWVFDLDVLARQADLLETFGADKFLPEKAEVARRIYQVGETATDNKDKLAAYKLYSELRGFVPKGDGNSTNVNVTLNRVMVMRDFGSNEDWEAKAVAQQTKLIEHSRD